jgi:hypothetical protein
MSNFIMASAESPDGMQPGLRRLLQPPFSQANNGVVISFTIPGRKINMMA